MPKKRMTSEEGCAIMAVSCTDEKSTAMLKKVIVNDGRKKK